MTVNMDKDHTDLYLNLNDLLKDICRFLETSSLKLSPADKIKAEALIERSKKYLQVFAKISADNQKNDCRTPANTLPEKSEINNINETERYVDMSKKPALPQRTLVVEPQLGEPKSPFQDLSAKEASQEIKYGTLSKRRRVLNILDLSTKVYAVIHENWLLLYGSNKDPKPHCALDLKLYEAQEDEIDPSLTQLGITRDESFRKNSFNKMAASFKVFHSSSPDKKCYNFVAMTHKDMLQWVVSINRQHDKAVLASKENKDDQNYEICQDLQGLEKEENIYNEIEMPPRHLHSPPIIKEIPENDDRPAIPKKLPKVPEKSLSESLSTSTESMALYQQLEARVVTKKPTDKCSLNSFESSEEDEDQTYYELDTVNKEIKIPLQKHGKEDQDNFDVPPPPLPVKSIADCVEDEEDLTYENSFSLAVCKLPKEIDKPNDVNNESKKVVLKPSVLRDAETPEKPQLPEKNVSTSLTSKPTILSPKPWKPFKKNISSKSPPILKNKSIRESLKSPSTPQNKSCLDVPSDKPTDENSVLNKNDSVKTSNDNLTSKTNQGSSIVKIIRNRWSTSQNTSCNFETFSRNSKIETFQANPTKESLPTNFVGSDDADVHDSLSPLSTLISESGKDDKNIDEKPMVLLKATLEDEDSSKKLKKSPVIPVKPKKVARNLAF